MRCLCFRRRLQCIRLFLLLDRQQRIQEHLLRKLLLAECWCASLLLGDGIDPALLALAGRRLVEVLIDALLAEQISLTLHFFRVLRAWSRVEPLDALLLARAVSAARIELAQLLLRTLVLNLALQRLDLLALGQHSLLALPHGRPVLQLLRVP